MARRFMKNMTIDKVQVLAEVTGLPYESVFALHPCSGANEQRHRILVQR